MTTFIYGLIGSVELMVIFGLIHFLLSRHKKTRNWWLVPIVALLCSFGYAFVIFVIEGEASNSFNGNLTDTLPLYLFVFTFYSIFFSTIYATIKIVLDYRKGK